MLKKVQETLGMLDRISQNMVYEMISADLINLVSKGSFIILVCEKMIRPYYLQARHTIPTAMQVGVRVTSAKLIIVPKIPLPLWKLGRRVIKQNKAKEKE